MTSSVGDPATNNAHRQTWIAAAAVILTVIGAAWWTGRQMATREDLAALRQEMTAEHTLIRQEMTNAHTLIRQEMTAEHALIRQEMAAAHALIRDEIASQMRELRGYIVDHLEGHPPANQD